MTGGSAAGTTGTRSLRPVAAWVLGLGALVLVAVLGGRSVSTEPFDPESTEGDGLRALVLVLEELGAEVEVSSSVPADADVAAVLRNDGLLAEAQVARLEAFLEDGGTVVVSDPSSPLTPVVDGPIGDVGIVQIAETIPPGACDVDALARAGAIEAAQSVRYEAGGAASCFGDGGVGYVVVEERGRGTLVSLGGTTPLTNEYLGDADNAYVAAALLAPREGTRITLLQEPSASELPEGATVDSPFELLDDRVPQALLQLGLAFVVIVAWQARRLGAPLRDLRPVEIQGSELVVGVGNLLQRSGGADRAASMLRTDLRRTLCERFGLAATAGPQVVADAVAVRTGVDRDRLERALTDIATSTDADVLAVAAEIHSLRQEIFDEPSR